MRPTMNVNSPTIYNTVNRIPVNYDETVLSIFLRLQAEQRTLNKHAYAPHHHLSVALNKENEGDGEVFMEAFILRDRVLIGCLFLLTGSLSELRKVQGGSRTDCGLLWNFVMLSEEEEG
jgi:hypothetical protein